VGCAGLGVCVRDRWDSECGRCGENVGSVAGFVLFSILPWNIRAGMMTLCSVVSREKGKGIDGGEGRKSN